MTQIAGASPQQRALLEKILGGLPGTQIRRLRVEPEYDLEPERDADNNPPADWDPTTPLGDSLRLMEPAHPDLRTQWELEMVGAAFHRSSAKSGLTRIVAVSSQNGGPYFWDEDRSVERSGLTREEEDAQVQSAAATTGAVLDRVEFLEPEGLAVAVTLAVPEPHGFLRHGLAAFSHLSGEHDGARDGSNLEVVDGTSKAAYQRGCRDSGCASSSRADVACCAPRGFGRGIMDPGPPPCPFPSRTWEDMWDAFRRDLAGTTGRDLAGWLELMGPERLETRWDRLLWLKREHGLGQARAYAIATADE